MTNESSSLQSSANQQNADDAGMTMASTSANNPEIPSSASSAFSAKEKLAEEQDGSKTTSNTTTTTAKVPKQAIVRRPRRRRRGGGGGGNLANTATSRIPELDPRMVDQALRESGLPLAYSFEIPKTVKRIVELQARHVALQMPEGLLMYATVLADVLQRLSQTLAAAVVESAPSNKVETTSTTTTNTDKVKELVGEDQQEKEKMTRPDTATTTTTSPTCNDDKSKVCCQQVSVLGDVTYGACCIGDLDAQALGADLLVHYGHSCLVPLQHTVLPCLYVFVEIQIDCHHLVESLHATIQQQQRHEQQQQEQQNDKDYEPKLVVLYLLGTIQFRHCLGELQQLLQTKGYDQVYIPQAKPLSPGEVLGCTSPKLNQHENSCTPGRRSKHKQRQEQQHKQQVNSEVEDGQVVVIPHDAKTSNNTRIVCCFVADGRFHLESTMISNPHVHVFYRYDPYGKTLTTESYDHHQMQSLRWDAIQQTRTTLVRASTTNNTTTTTTFGILMGTLGRQGNPAIVQRIRQALALRQEGEHQEKDGKTRVLCRSFILLLSEITPTKLALLDSKVDIWVQVACPRLSVDWGHYLAKNQKPVLTPYELFVALEETPWLQDGIYPMDYYASQGGPWSNYHVENKTRQLDASSS